MDWIMTEDRLEHFCRLQVISLDKAALIAVGILPEKVYVDAPVWWIDGGQLMGHDSKGWTGDDVDGIFQWVADCKERWISQGKPREGISLVEFINWVSVEYESPHWLKHLEELRLWQKWTAGSTSSINETPAERTKHVIEVLAKHGGNKTNAGKELGISRQRVSQYASKHDESDRKPFTFSAQDPFGLSGKPASKKRSK